MCVFVYASLLINGDTVSVYPCVGIEQIKVSSDGVVCIPEDVVVCGQTGLTFVSGIHY